MSSYIVLVKQVPDVSQITDNAFDPETGNLMRAKLPSVINELDAQALGFAVSMRDAQPSKAGKIVALTMGPPMAEAVLRYSLARGADEGVLLTDRCLGGADTWATANPLAAAVRKIQKDIFKDDRDYFVVAGMQSVDGDTAQVPAQLADELKIPCIAYATGVAYKNDRFEFTRIVSGGSQVVASRSVPAAITVSKFEYPLFPTVASTRAANRKEIVQWSAADVGATRVGVKGSKTRVIRVFPPPKTSRKCQHVPDSAALAQIIRETYKVQDDQGASAGADNHRYVLPAKRANVFDRSFEGMEKDSKHFDLLAARLRELGVQRVEDVTDELKAKLLETEGLTHREVEHLLEGLKAGEPTYQGEVWVVAEHNNHHVHPSTFELVGKGRDLADSLQTHVGVVLVGKKVQQHAKDLIAAGADKVYVVEDAVLEEFDPTTYQKAVCEVISKHWPQIVLYAATPQGRVLAPLISYRLDCGLTADCTSLDVRDTSKKAQIAVLMQTRPALGGNVMATICTKDSRTQMATARPGVMKRLDADPTRTGEIITEKVALSDDDRSLDILSSEQGDSDVNLNADVIVSGGKGLASKDSFDRLTNELCSTIADTLHVEVERGASRAAVEQGFADRAHQIGQTGTAVAPKIYIAMGISGAIQHMIGVANSQTIIAINRDPNAPVLHQCDYYVLGSVEDVIPELIEKLGAESAKV